MNPNSTHHTCNRECVSSRRSRRLSRACRTLGLRPMYAASIFREYTLSSIMSSPPGTLASIVNISVHTGRMYATSVCRHSEPDPVPLDLAVRCVSILVRASTPATRRLRTLRSFHISAISSLYRESVERIHCRVVALSSSRSVPAMYSGFHTFILTVGNSRPFPHSPIHTYSSPFKGDSVYDFYKRHVLVWISVIFSGFVTSCQPFICKLRNYVYKLFK